MAICKDPNDQIERNASLVTNLNDISPDGTLRPSFATTAIEEYSRLVSADIQQNVQATVIDRFVNQYGQEAFDAGLIAINNTLINREVFQTNLANYPDLQNRLNRPIPITPIEYANYMDEFLQNPNTVVSLVNSNTPLMQSQLNDFYRNNFTQSAIGSFCALMPSVFGAIAGFFDLVDDVQQVFQDAVDFINNFSLQDLVKKLTMKNLINKIKEQITKIIDDTVNKVKGIIENLSFENIIGQIETFVNDSIIGRFIELRAQALSFFSEENIERLKKKVENLFNYAASIFKDPSLEEIQFLVYRFCEFAGQIETALNLLKKPLDDFVDDYQTTYNILRSSGRVATSSAVSEGGANRYSDEERKARINNGKDKAAAQPVTPAGDWTDEEKRDLERLLSSIETFIADPRFEIGGGFSWGKTPNQGDADNRKAARILGLPLDKPIQTPAEAWTRQAEPGAQDALLGLIRLQKLYSEEKGRNVVFIVNSAFRSEKLNTFLRRSGILRNGRTGVASNSLHINAKAFDIKWSGFSLSEARLVRNIAQNKCKLFGVGIYNSFIHVDTGRKRTW